jgi:hypothetical protein
MRRRLNLDKLSDQILVVVHKKFFDDAVEYISFQQIRDSIQDQPANAIRLELANLVAAHRVIQETEERTRPSGFLSTMSQSAATYVATIDGYKISKSGIVYIEGLSEDYYASLEQEFITNAAISESSDNEEAQWEPIPLDRADNKQEAAIKALDKIIEDLRSDNGYASSNPEEKAFVQEGLSATSKRLKEDTQTSWMYIREFALKPIQILIKRFGVAAIGLAASAAKEALLVWLKSKGVNFLDGIF